MDNKLELALDGKEPTTRNLIIGQSQGLLFSIEMDDSLLREKLVICGFLSSGHRCYEKSQSPTGHEADLQLDPPALWPITQGRDNGRILYKNKNL